MERETRQNGDPGDRQHGDLDLDLGLDELRDEIEEIDSELVELIARRTYVAESIARVKQERDIPIHDPDREERVLERIEDRARELDLDPEGVRDVFGSLMALSKRHQRDCDDDG